MFSRLSNRVFSTFTKQHNNVRSLHTTTRTSTKSSNVFKTSNLLLFGLVATGTVTYYTIKQYNNDNDNISLVNTAYADAPETEVSGKQGLSPNEFRPFRVKEIKPYNYNSNIIVLDVEDPNKPLNLPCASFILTKANIDGKDVIRPYTPINQYEPGVINLLIKKYETGVMSKHLHSLKCGDTIDIKGITPMAQVIEEVTRNPNDKTNITLLFANIGPHDILLREKFDAIAATHPNFKPVYIVESNAESGMITGRINADLLKKYLPKPDPSNQILVCGPQGMMAAISGTKAKDFSQGELDGLLKQLGYTKDNVYKF